ncbi:MAG: DUF4252 domain-containing protein [Blastocatellia bacterium]
MNKSRLKFMLPVFLFVICSAVPARAQRLQIDSIESLFPKAAETIDVTLDSSLIKLASKFLSNNKPEEAAIREIMSALEGVYVKGVTFDKEGEFSDSDIEPIRNQLRAPGWDRIAGVRSKRSGDNVEVCLMVRDEKITGIGVLVWSPKEVFIVNVVGPIDPEKITQLRGRFGIPDIDLDFGGVDKAKIRTRKGGK